MPDRPLFSDEDLARLNAGVLTNDYSAGPGQTLVTEIAQLRDEVTFAQARLERIEAMMVLLCEQAMRGQGQSGEPFQRFIDDWRRNHGY